MGPLQSDQSHPSLPSPPQTPDIEKLLGQLPHISSGHQRPEKSDTDPGSAHSHDEVNLLSQDTNDFLKNMNLGYGYDESSEGEIFEGGEEKDNGGRRVGGGSIRKQTTGNFGLDSYQPEVVTVNSGGGEGGGGGECDVLESGGKGGGEGGKGFGVIGKGGTLESGYVAGGVKPNRPSFGMIGKGNTLESGYVAGEQAPKRPTFGMVGQKEVLQSGFVADAPDITKEDSFHMIGKKNVVESGIVMDQRQEESKPAIAESINWTG
jgi:hypothetical protein